MVDYNFVTARLATGGGLNGLPGVQQLRNAGITHVVDTMAEFNDAQWLGPSFHYLWNPTKDDGQHPKPPEWFAKTIEFTLAALTYQRTKVYCHCSMGQNRGPSALYSVLLALGVAPDAAETMVRDARPSVTLAYKDDAVAAVNELGYLG